MPITRGWYISYLISRIKIWQFAICNYLCIILSYYRVAFVAQDYAVIFGFASPFGKGYAWDSKPPNPFFRERLKPDILTASGTDTSPTIVPILPQNGFFSSYCGELHNKPPLYEWRKGRIDDYWLCSDGKQTGMVINTISRLWLARGKAINLKCPSYHITFFVNTDIGDIRQIVEAPTLDKAKELAEWYYAEWLKVNQELIIN